MHTFRLFCIFLCFAFLLACSTPVKQQRVRPPFWPSLPDLPRFEYEFTLRSDLSIEKKEKFDSFKSIVTGRQKRARIRLIKPLDIAAYQGHIIVSDSVMRLVYLFDVPRRLVVVFGRSGDGRLQKPLGVAIDHAINYYVADATKRCVVVYDSGGHFKHYIGKPDDLVKPTDVAVSGDGKRIYVVDMGGVDSTRHRIVAYNAEGEKLFTIGERGRALGKFNLPTHAAVAPDGTLYVLDAGNFRIQAFDPNGKYLYSWGDVGSAFGRFARPRGLAVDADGNVYVSDASFGNVQIFNPKGQLLMALGQGGQLDRAGHYALVAGVAVDETGRIYVVDQLFRKVEVIKRLNEAEGQAIMREFGIKPPS